MSKKIVKCIKRIAQNKCIITKKKTSRATRVCHNYLLYPEIIKKHKTYFTPISYVCDLIVNELSHANKISL